MKTTLTSGNLTKFLELLDQKGVTPELFQHRLSNGVLSDIFDPSATFQNRDQWRNAFGLRPIVPEAIILNIDYSMSIEEMVATGRYDWVNSDLTTKRFPIKGGGTEDVEAKIFHFDRSISSEEAKRLIEEAGWEVAKTEHLLAFGAKHPDEQRKFPIVALGSVGKVNGNRNVPYLSRNDSKRNLNLNWWDNDWNSNYRFLAVRNFYSFSRDSLSRVLFKSCFFQPPNIFPISEKFSER